MIVRTSWVPVPDGSDFSIHNLPYGVFRDERGTRCGIAIGEAIFDLAAAERSGLFADTALAADTFNGPDGTTLNAFIAQGQPAWTAVRATVADMLDRTNTEAEKFSAVHNLLISDDVEMLLPIDVGDYVDFYSSEHHATNLGRMFRPDGDALLPNWKHLPVGYHGRAGTVVVSGTPIARPSGQRRGPDGPTFGSSEKLDIELEVGFITGNANALGEPVPVESAEDHIFGMCLVNDWSARDIQAWEYVPLGPFLGKSFATSISPWIVPMDALAPFRGDAPEQDPAPLPYLCDPNPRGVDIRLSVTLKPAGSDETREITNTSFATMYWTMAQQLTHATVNGATARAGDLFASGTVSGPTEHERGSLIEITWNGRDPIVFDDGTERTFLEDGDTVILAGHCITSDGQIRVGFGTCEGVIES